MSVPTRLGPKGVTNAVISSLLNKMGQLDPTRYNTFFEDFNNSSDAVATTPLNWTATAVGAGTRAVAALDGGAILLTNAAADNDSIALQIKNPSFILNAGKQSWFESRFKISDATQSDFLIGLTGLDTTPIGAAASEETGVADGIFFLKIDGQTDLRLYARKASATVTSKLAIATIVADTMISAGWHYDGKEFKIYVNDLHVTSVDAPFATGVPALVIGPNLMIQNGEAVAKTATIDRIFACQER